MSSNSLDNLATNGIINFDADAFVRGTTPKFVGTPTDEYSYGDAPLMATPYLPYASHTKAHNQHSNPYGIKAGPHLSKEYNSQDTFISSEKEHSLPSAKSILAGGLVAALIGGIVLKGSSILKKGSIQKFFENCKNKLSSAFDSTKKITDNVTKEVKENSGENIEKIKKHSGKVLESVKGFASKHSQKLKIAGVGVLGLLGLYGLYEILTEKNKSKM